VVNLADTRLDDSFMASPDYLASSGKKESVERAMSARSYTIRTAFLASCLNSDLEGPTIPFSMCCRAPSKGIKGVLMKH